MYKDKWWNYFFPGKDQPLPDKHTLWRKFAQSLSSDVNETLMFYKT